MRLAFTANTSTIHVYHACISSCHCIADVEIREHDITIGFVSSGRIFCEPFPSWPQIPSAWVPSVSEDVPFCISFLSFQTRTKVKVGSKKKKKKHLRKATSFSSCMLLSIVYFLLCFLLSSVDVNSLHGSDQRFSSSEKRVGGKVQKKNKFNYTQLC